MNYQDVIEITGGLEYLGKRMDKKEIRIDCFENMVMIQNAEFPLLLSDAEQVIFETEYGWKFDYQAMAFVHKIQWCNCPNVKKERLRVISMDPVTKRGVLCHVDCERPLACRELGKKLHPADGLEITFDGREIPKCQECMKKNDGILRF